MAILADQEATLSQAATKLFTAGFGRAQLKVTGIAGEFTAIPLRVKSRLAFTGSQWHDATEADLGLLGGSIFARAPEGVGSLDIVYEVRTGGDAPRLAKGRT
jgi:hypothetical protein